MVAIMNTVPATIPESEKAQMTPYAETTPNISRPSATTIAGLMSDSPAREVAAKAERMVAAMAECGCTLNNAYMQHSLLALVVIPSLRISDLGLVDVDRFELTDLFTERAQ